MRLWRVPFRSGARSHDVRRQDRRPIPLHVARVASGVPCLDFILIRFLAMLSSYCEVYVPVPPGTKELALVLLSRHRGRKKSRQGTRWRQRSPEKPRGQTSYRSILREFGLNSRSTIHALPPLPTTCDP